MIPNLHSPFTYFYAAALLWSSILAIVMLVRKPASSSKKPAAVYSYKILLLYRDDQARRPTILVVQGNTGIFQTTRSHTAAAELKVGDVITSDLELKENAS